MLDEISIRWPAIDTSKIYLSGFCGGGQCVHRFMYLYPECLRAVSVSAPGNVTALDFDKPWPAGLADAEMIFSVRVDVDTLKRLPILVAVGGEDKTGNASKVRRLIKGDAYGDEGEVNKTRVQRLTDLVEQWRRLSMNVEFEVVPGVKHEMEKVTVAVKPFMTRQLDEYWRKHG